MILSQGSVVQDAHLLHPWAHSWSCLFICTSFFLEFIKPYPPNRYIQSWLPFAYSAAIVLLLTIEPFELSISQSVSPSPAEVSSPVDETWPAATLLLTLHICSILTHSQFWAREALPDSSCPRPTSARLDSWPFYLESSGWKFKLENQISWTKCPIHCIMTFGKSSQCSKLAPHRTGAWGNGKNSANLILSLFKILMFCSPWIFFFFTLLLIFSNLDYWGFSGGWVLYNFTSKALASIVPTLLLTSVSSSIK